MPINGRPLKILLVMNKKEIALSIINVSVQTVDIIKSLPTISFGTNENLIETENNIYNLDESFDTYEQPIQAPMKEFSLNEGIYFINDVVQITRLK
jgi:hypothetical protein